jgi:hypothetical protein
MALIVCLDGRSKLTAATKNLSGGDFSNEYEAIPQCDPCQNRDHVLPLHHLFCGSDLVPKEKFAHLQPHEGPQSRSQRSAYPSSETFAEIDMRGGLGCDSYLAKDE